MPKRPADYPADLKAVLHWEGGYVNDPADPGGATNFGITQGTYDLYLATKGSVPCPVRTIKQEDVAAIYSSYWNRMQCGGMQEPLARVAFDTAVNCGVKQTSLWLQRNMGFEGKDVDGIVGPKTLAAVQAEDPGKAAEDLLRDREDHYLRLVNRKPEMHKFLKGWTNRVEDMRRWIQVCKPQ